MERGESHPRAFLLVGGFTPGESEEKFGEEEANEGARESATGREKEDGGEFNRWIKKEENGNSEDNGERDEREFKERFEFWAFFWVIGSAFFERFFHGGVYEASGEESKSF